MSSRARGEEPDRYTGRRRHQSHRRKMERRSKIRLVTLGVLLGATVTIGGAMSDGFVGGPPQTAALAVKPTEAPPEFPDDMVIPDDEMLTGEQDAAEQPPVKPKKKPSRTESQPATTQANTNDQQDTTDGRRAAKTGRHPDPPTSAAPTDPPAAPAPEPTPTEEPAAPTPAPTDPPTSPTPTPEPTEPPEGPTEPTEPTEPAEPDPDPTDPTEPTEPADSPEPDDPDKKESLLQMLVGALTG